MNKHEVSEIKRNFRGDSGYFTTDRILVGFIDAEKNLLYHKVHSITTMPAEEFDVYKETLLHVLSTNVGNKFTEYEFPNSAYDIGGSQNILYNLVNTKLKDDSICEKYLTHIKDNIDYTGPFTIITACCTYSVPKKNKNDDVDFDMNEDMYCFTLTAICPADTGNDGFIFDKSDNEVLKKLNTELIIDKIPTDGFLFPVFSNRSSDINHVMYYTKSSKTLNLSIIEDVLGCVFNMSADKEKEYFKTILSNVAGDDLDYTLINTVNEKIRNIINDNSSETDSPVIEPVTLKHILMDTGLSEERINMINPLFEKICMNKPLMASNVVDSKTVIKIEGITLNINSSAVDTVRTSTVDGRKCILIDITEPIIEINDFSVNLNS